MEGRWSRESRRNPRSPRSPRETPEAGAAAAPGRLADVAGFAGLAAAAATAVAALTLAWPASLSATTSFSATVALPATASLQTAAPAQQAERGSLEVTVVVEETGRPVPAADVRLQPVDRRGVTNPSGRLVMEGLRPGTYTLSVRRLGFMPREREVEVVAGERTRVEVSLTSSPIRVGDLVVTGTVRERGVADVYRPTTSLSDVELQRSLTTSVPETLSGVPGFAVQYNGPGAASPSIRGMGGDRVLMLEDGHRTGDLYQTASDHGVMVEPLSARRMEVVRGPAGLLYGSNALGGVVNVIREDVPRSRVDRLTGTLSSQFESVNEGVAGAAVVRGPLGPLTFRAEATIREADDTRTPLGDLPRTQMSVYNLAGGLSWADDWGFAGAAVRHFDTVYGVPGEFDGQLIPGGHPGGVDIEATRTSARFRGAYREPVFGFFQNVELDGHVTRYIHDEIEGVIEGEPVLGARFDQTTADVNLVAHHDHKLHDHPDDPIRAEGAFGLSFQSRDLTAGGVQPGTRSGSEWAVAGFAFEEFSRGSFRLQAGLRLDHRSVTPASLDSIVVRTLERRISKPVEERSFTALSGSVAGLWDFAEEWTLGLNLARSFRNPTIEELYSDGPHLADFSFDIGSPDLDTEMGTGVDLFLRANRSDFSLELATYVNRIDDYIFYLQTGETVRVFREGERPREIPVFEARGEDALFLGGEGRVQWEFLSDLVLDLTASYTRATRREDSDPLPFIPPLSGKVEARWEGDRFFGSVGADFSAAQNRVPGPVEIGDSSALPQEPTDGYGLLNAGFGIRHQGSRLLHTVTLEAKNLTDAVWRDHLSRIKEIAPQPGRNIQLTYRVGF